MVELRETSCVPMMDELSGYADASEYWETQEVSVEQDRGVSLAPPPDGAPFLSGYASVEILGTGIPITSQRERFAASQGSNRPSTPF